MNESVYSRVSSYTLVSGAAGSSIDTGRDVDIPTGRLRNRSLIIRAMFSRTSSGNSSSSILSYLYVPEKVYG